MRMDRLKRAKVLDELCEYLNSAGFPYFDRLVRSEYINEEDELPLVMRAWETLCKSIPGLKCGICIDEGIAPGWYCWIRLWRERDAYWVCGNETMVEAVLGCIEAILSHLKSPEFTPPSEEEMRCMVF